MSTDLLLKPDDVDEETLQALQDSVEDELVIISNKLTLLERDGGNKDVINALMRSLHSIKGNCRMCFLVPLSDFVHSLEDSLSEVRAGRLPFTPLLGETVLLCLDQLKIRIEELIRSRRSHIAMLNAMAPLLRQITTVSPQDIQPLLEQIIETGGGTVAHFPSEQHLEPTTDLETALEMGERNGDIGFFMSMGELVDTKCQYWNQRTRTQLKIALGINRHLKPKPADPYQLAAAICLHDLGMAFLPGDLINKAQKYNALEEKRIQQHVKLSFEWVRRLPGWSQAASMVAQHHERPDGAGYPYGLKGDQICAGAQIVAITDTFYSITNERSDRTYKKSLLRAITEINAYDELQFQGAILAAFNDLMRNIYAKQNGSGLQMA